MTPLKISKVVLDLHAKWRNGDPGGERANLTGAVLTDACLTDACLADARLAGANLAGAYLTRADLAGADLTGACLAGARLSGADLAGADLTRADLTDTNLTSADLTGAVGLPVAPIIPHIDAAILSAINGHKLEMAIWRSKCGMTYCRGGFAILLAEEAGAELEARTSPYLAARLIYEASRPGIPCPDFFASNESAMADLRECAERDPLP